jgi:hypothetical protein
MSIAEESFEDYYDSFHDFIGAVEHECTGKGNRVKNRGSDPDYSEQTYTFADGSRLTVVVTTD